MLELALCINVFQLVLKVDGLKWAGYSKFVKVKDVLKRIKDILLVEVAIVGHDASKEQMWHWIRK